jgi:hypothetical protein
VQAVPTVVVAPAPAPVVLPLMIKNYIGRADESSTEKYLKAKID